MNIRKPIVIPAVTALAAAGLVLGIGGFTSSHAPKTCTMQDGLCQVEVFVLTHPGKPNQVWTCVLTRDPAPEGQGVAFPGYTCYLPGSSKVKKLEH
jgi:hypothetical protein